MRQSEVLGITVDESFFIGASGGGELQGNPPRWLPLTQREVESVLEFLGCRLHCEFFPH